jgi:hypothetical protein
MPKMVGSLTRQTFAKEHTTLSIRLSFGRSQGQRRVTLASPPRRRRNRAATRQPDLTQRLHRQLRLAPKAHPPEPTVRGERVLHTSAIQHRRLSRDRVRRRLVRRLTNVALPPSSQGEPPALDNRSGFREWDDPQGRPVTLTRLFRISKDRDTRQLPVLKLVSGWWTGTALLRRKPPMGIERSAARKRSPRKPTTRLNGPIARTVPIEGYRGLADRMNSAEKVLMHPARRPDIGVDERADSKASVRLAHNLQALRSSHPQPGEKCVIRVQWASTRSTRRSGQARPDRHPRSFSSP